MDNKTVFDSALASFQDSDISERSYYPEFREKWEDLLFSTIDGEEYYDLAAPSVYTVSNSFDGVDAEFHFDQLKIADWYRQDSSRRKRVVFLAKTFKRSRKGVLTFHESICDYDSAAPEESLTDADRNIVAAAFPQLPPRLSIVYGNKWVESRFNSLLATRLSLFLMETDYVPAFLGSPFEVCLYLYLMDLCIIKENYSKMEDDYKLRDFLHIFRPSPMLRIKGITQ